MQNKTAVCCKETGGQWQSPSPIRGYSRGVCLTQRSVQWMPPSNKKTDRWQMISPIASQQCETFGSADPWSDGKESSDGIMRSTIGANISAVTLPHYYYQLKS